ncbi:MAG: hypothetical protein FJ010_07930 [Chloroflexi bacterium]|nr:hypothetical protein [Chloroflexota bacterium]
MGKFLRFIGILFLSISALFNIAGGAGTTCVALNPTGYDGKFAAIAGLQWLYILYVLVTLAFGVMMARAVVLLIKGRDNAYRYSLISLIGATIVGVIHIITSRALRGSSMPVDGVVYTTALTLVIFLIFKIPGVWAQVDFTKAKKKDSEIAGGAAAIIVGALCLTIQYLMAPTHTINGVNYGDAFNLTMTVTGGALMLTGLGMLIRAWRKSPHAMAAVGKPEISA